MSALPDRSPNPRPRSGERRVAYNPQSEVAASPIAMDMEAQLRASLRALNVDPPDDGEPPLFKRTQQSGRDGGGESRCLQSEQQTDSGHAAGTTVKSAPTAPPAARCAWCDKPMRDTQALTLDRERHKFCERADHNGRRQYRCSGLDDYTLTHDAFQGHVRLKMDGMPGDGVYINKDVLSAVRDALSECIAAQRAFDDDGGGDDDDYGECA